MNLLRKILFPFAAIYGGITQLRNFLFDRQIFKSHTFDVPVIAVGNLSVGGTGKSPQIEYLIRLLSQNYKIATLSRGYKRKSSGFVLADSNSTAALLGDEPFQFYKKFPEIIVAVDADRKNGIKKLLSLPNNPDIILLDDAFQHRHVNAGLYILLTTYGDLYSDDFILPTGNLRESRRGAKRADIIIVTKCPQDLSAEEQLTIQIRLNPRSKQQVFFSYIDYDSDVYSTTSRLPVSAIKTTPKLLVAGIAKPKNFFDFLRGDDDTMVEYPDHHHFSEKDFSTILRIANGRPIVTTEKDFVRLDGRVPLNQLYYLPIKSAFCADGASFDNSILDYVAKQIS